MSNRRHFFRDALGLGAGLFSASGINAQQESGSRWSSSTTSTSGYVVRHPPGL